MIPAWAVDRTPDPHAEVDSGLVERVDLAAYRSEVEEAEFVGVFPNKTKPRLFVSGRFSGSFCSFSPRKTKDHPEVRRNRLLVVRRKTLQRCWVSVRPSTGDIRMETVSFFMCITFFCVPSYLTRLWSYQNEVPVTVIVLIERA